MGDTKIEWTEKTWNPIRARRTSSDERGWYCEHVSEGCRNCYAEKMNRNTYFGNGLEYKPTTLPDVDLFLDEKILQQPLHWSKPQSVFPCSMTDLFGRWVKDEWLLKIFDVMRRCPQHTFQILTKRAERMKYFCSRLRFDGKGAGRIWIEPADVHTVGYRLMGGNGATGMPWVWLGTSVEDQKTADERIPLLLQTPAAIRWISAEPLLGPVDLSKEYLTALLGKYPFKHYSGPRTTIAHLLDWVVVGGESGPKARPMHPDWARSLIAQCRSAEVPVFVKQMGKAPIGLNLRDSKGGDQSEWPDDLRVREYPVANALLSNAAHSAL
jgi:protein gp37